MRCFGAQYRCIFLLVLCILIPLRARQNTAELVKIYSDIVHSGEARLVCLVMQNFSERRRREPFRGVRGHSPPENF